MTYPATHEDVVAVTAMNENDTLASYSSVGSAVDLLAPGTNVSDTWFGGVGELDGWSIEVSADGVTFTAPEGEFQPWFTLYNFEIEVDAEPVGGELTLGLGEGAVEPRLDVAILAPSLGSAVPADIFDDRFEALGMSEPTSSRLAQFPMK